MDFPNVEICIEGQGQTENPVPPVYDDPLDEDCSRDLLVSTSRRGLCRLTLLAAEVGARFARHDAQLDPMAWLLAPRDLFEGRAAIDACLERTHFLRALLLHGLEMGLDADPGEIDDLLRDDEFPPRADHERESEASQRPFERHLSAG
jgi:hypothetical protein